MTILRLQREPSQHGATLGSLYLNNVWQCFTLEDAIADVKIPGRTAIPAGRYPVVLTPSRRFQRVLPLLRDVPAFDGIRIHAGNVIADTAGCVLVGRDRAEAAIRQSRVALESLLEALTRATTPIEIRIENPPALEGAA